MGVGYFQLSNRTPQDLYLVGNPQYTHFKTVFKRYTNFAIEPLLTPFNGDTAETWGRRLYSNIARNGDLLYRCYLVFRINVRDTATQEPFNIATLGTSLIEWVQISLGDQIIDKQYGEWLYIDGALNETFDKSSLLYEMEKINPLTTDEQHIFIPLRFWFNKNPGLSVPLIALQNSPLKLDLQVNTKEQVFNQSNVNINVKINSIQLLCEYVHLDAEEKRLFASNKHDYLIEQVQSTVNNPVPLNLTNPRMTDEEYERTNFTYDLNFNHPVKEIFWVVQDSNSSSLNSQSKNYNLYNFWRNFVYEREQIKEGTLVLNNKEVFDYKPNKFFRLVQNWEYHNSDRYYDLSFPSVNRENLVPCVYKYSFSLNPTDLQPSGTLNFSALDRAQLRLKFLRDMENFTLTGPNNVQSKVIRFYAVNYNMLRVQSGQGALAYIN